MSYMKISMLLVLCILFFGSSLNAESEAFTLTSNNFSEGNNIPDKFTCEGDNISPHLTWSDPPEETRSLAIICDDPDAPAGTWVHWIIFNLDPKLRELKEGVDSSAILGGCENGRNDFGSNKYGGPCPPPGKTHRYFFRLYALDKKFDLKSGCSRKDLEKVMENHILRSTKLMGTFKR